MADNIAASAVSSSRKEGEDCNLGAFCAVPYIPPHVERSVAPSALRDTGVLKIREEKRETTEDLDH